MAVGKTAVSDKGSRKNCCFRQGR